MQAVTVDAWVDFGCPWSRIALVELDRAITHFDGPVDIRLHALRLDADAPDTYGQTTIEHLCSALGVDAEAANRMLDAVRDRGAEAGLTFNFDIARGGSTFDAHRLAHLAAQHGRHLELARALFTAHFELGELLSDHDVLTRIGIDAGLPADAVASTLRTDAYATAVHADEAEAAARGITKRPTFVISGNSIEGAATPAQFLAALRG